MDILQEKSAIGTGEGDFCGLKDRWVGKTRLAWQGALAYDLWKKEQATQEDPGKQEFCEVTWKKLLESKPN